MIESEFDATGGRIVLRPNRSWTWRSNLALIATLAAVAGSVAIGFAVQGLWLVLPFTGIELAALGTCLYYCVRRTHLQEVLTFSRDDLVFERGIGKPSMRRQFKRYFARFLVRAPVHPWYQPRVALACQGRELEIGSFLSVEEKAALVTALQQMIQRLDARDSRRQ